MFTSRSPLLDLHGEYCSMAPTLVNEFIVDNVKMKIEFIGIIHGKSTGLMTKKVHDILKSNTYVKDFYINPTNVGMTVVQLILK